MNLTTLLLPAWARPEEKKTELEACKSIERIEKKARIQEIRISRIEAELAVMTRQETAT